MYIYIYNCVYITHQSTESQSDQLPRAVVARGRLPHSHLKCAGRKNWRLSYHRVKSSKFYIDFQKSALWSFNTVNSQADFQNFVSACNIVCVWQDFSKVSIVHSRKSALWSVYIVNLAANAHFRIST